MPLVDNFDIIIEIQEPTRKQMSQEKYLIQHRMVVQDSNIIRDWLLDILSDNIDFSSFPDKEFLLIRFKRTGTHKIEYSSIKNKKVKALVRRIIENSRPKVY